MNFINIITEPAILIITAFFLFCILHVIKNYIKVQTGLKSINEFLSSINKKELSYRYGSMNEFLSDNMLSQSAWEDFKKALIFPEKLYIASQNSKAVNDFNPEIYLTIDASYFFNEETLILSKINNKFIQAMPTLLTGLGPFFTFLKMAIAFAQIDFAATSVENSLNGLILNIQIAAICSVFAVGYSLLFILIEKILYNRMCRRYCLHIQNEFIRLFDVVTSEKFLIDLVKESKLQNINNEQILKSLPETFAKAITKSTGETIIPYLENILYSLNKLNENSGNNGGGDIVDKLF